MSISSDDQQLIERFLRGDPDAHHTIEQWVAIVVRAGQMGRLLYAHRDDIVQEVMLEVFGNLKSEKFNGRSSLKIYVKKMAQNICVNWWWRDSGKQGVQFSLDDLPHEPIDPGKNPYQMAETADREKKLAEAMRQLSQDCRELLQMAWEERRPYREIAAILSTTETVIKQRVHRCAQRLIQAIARNK